MTFPEDRLTSLIEYLDKQSLWADSAAVQQALTAFWELNERYVRLSTFDGQLRRLLLENRIDIPQDVGGLHPDHPE